MDARPLARLANLMEGVMMCRVTAPLTPPSSREAASRPPHRSEEGSQSARSALHRRLRILRHRALRWFANPIAITERERRVRELDPSVWRYGFPPRPVLH